MMGCAELARRLLRQAGLTISFLFREGHGHSDNLVVGLGGQPSDASRVYAAAEKCPNRDVSDQVTADCFLENSAQLRGCLYPRAVKRGSVLALRPPV